MSAVLLHLKKNKYAADSYNMLISYVYIYIYKSFIKVIGDVICA
jgi:hypothetical protein